MIWKTPCKNSDFARSLTKRKGMQPVTDMCTYLSFGPFSATDKAIDPVDRRAPTSGSMSAALTRHLATTALAELVEAARPAKVSAQDSADCFAAARISARSSGMGMRLKGVTFEPPVFPSGMSPMAVLVAAPKIRKIWPKISRMSRLCAAHTSMRQWTRTCSPVEI